MSEYTLSHSEKANGYTSFWSFIPDLMLRLNNRFYTVKNGQLYLHNEEGGPQNNFYNQQFKSKVSTVINESNSEDKIFKTMVLESNKPWKVDLETNFTNSRIEKEEFNKRESRYFSYIRKNQDETNYHGNTANGIGVITGFSYLGNVLTLTYNAVPNYISVGDNIYQLNGSVQEFLGVADDIDFQANTITIIIPAQARKHNSKFNSKFN